MTKLVILAGGFGTRLAEETGSRPKPMVEIGDKPILWHIMKIYSCFGINEFVICCGYKSYIIKEYFANYFIHTSDVTFRLKNNEMEIHRSDSEPWNVTLVDTGENTMTGGRLKRVREYLDPKENFCLTYGDGVGNININDLMEFHGRHGKKATLTAARLPGRYGALDISEQNMVDNFDEKPTGDGAWINAGFFVLSPKVLDYIDGDNTTWEEEPLNILAASGELAAYRHEGFWQPMDTLREKNLLNDLWSSGSAPWKLW